MKQLAILGMAVAMLTGCATQTYVLSPTSKQMPTYDKGQTFFVGGIGQEQSVNAAEVCGGAHNVAQIKTLDAPLNIVIRAFQGIYTPRQIQVYCK